MIESNAGKTALLLGVQLPIVIGVTAWLARRDGVKLNWLRIAVVGTATVAVTTAVLFLVATSRFGTRDTIVLTLLGVVALCMGVAWSLARRARRGKPNRQIQHIAGKPGSG